MRDDLLEYGFDKEKVLRKARGEKLIPDDVGCWFLERNIIKKYSFEIKSFWVQNFDFDKYSYYLSWKDDIILDVNFNTSLNLSFAFKSIPKWQNNLYNE